MRRWTVLGAMVVFVGLVSSGCGWYVEGLGDKDLETCDCPTLQATVASIDWAGDGCEPNEIGQAVGFAETGQFPLVVSATYLGGTVAEGDELFEHAVLAMAGEGFAPLDGVGFPERNRSADYEGDTWTLKVSTYASAGEFAILVTTEKPDEKAPEYLAPLVDAFGTR